jgi:hypothetical protein
MDRSTASGSIAFDGTTLTRSVAFNISLDLHLPPVCTGHGAVACSTIAFIIGTPTCTDDGSDGCDCVLTADISDESSASYTLDGNEIVTDLGLATERRWEYCVADGVLTARESGRAVAEEAVVQVYSCAD